MLEAFGFVADPNLGIRLNASIRLGSMSTDEYFKRPSNMAFHDLTLKREG